MSSSLSGVINILASGIHDIQATRYSQLASGSIIIYDHLVTLDDEIELIWKSSWSWGKVLFILNRYFGLISVIINNYGLFTPNLTNSVSLRLFRWQGWTGLIACMIAEVILQMRLYAMYSLNKKVLALMSSSFIITSTTSAVIMGTVLSNITANAIPILPDLKFCVPMHIFNHFYAFWIPMLAFETLLCVLALLKGYETFRNTSPEFRSGRHLVSILIRDSVLYFIVMFATYLTNFLIFFVATQGILEIPIGFSVAMSCVMGNRISLNVRDLHREMELERSRTSEKRSLATSSTRTRSIVIPSGQMAMNDVEMAQLRSMKAETRLGT